MIPEIVLAELFLLFYFYFKYYGNLIFISYGILTSDELKYQNLTAELEERLPGYRVQSGYYEPPNVVWQFSILALLFLFKGLHNFILKGKIFGLLIVGALLAISMVSINGFGISYEGHSVYSRPSPEKEIPSVDQLVDIIKEEIPSDLTFPRGVLMATIAYVLYATLKPPRRRR